MHARIYAIINRWHFAVFIYSYENCPIEQNIRTNIIVEIFLFYTIRILTSRISEVVHVWTQLTVTVPTLYN